MRAPHLTWMSAPPRALSFRGSSSYRHYEADELLAGRFSDQLRTEGNFVYTRKLGTHHSWTIEYSAANNRYQDYGDTLTHHAGIGYSRDLTPSTRLALEAGPSYTQSLETAAELPRLPRLIQYQPQHPYSNNFNLYYRHSSGESTGMGSVSDIDNAGLGYSRSFKQRSISHRESPRIPREGQDGQSLRFPGLLRRGRALLHVEPLLDSELRRQLPQKRGVDLLESGLFESGLREPLRFHSFCRPSIAAGVAMKGPEQLLMRRGAPHDA